MQLNDVIKSIGLYWAFIVLPIQTDIAKNSTDTNTSIGIGPSLYNTQCNVNRHNTCRKIFYSCSLFSFFTSEPLYLILCGSQNFLQ